MKNILTSDLQLGDLWITGLDSRLWILIHKKEDTANIDEKIVRVWQLTWFGKKGQGTLGLIVDTWIDGSSFKILSRSDT